MSLSLASLSVLRAVWTKNWSVHKLWGSTPKPQKEPRSYDTHKFYIRNLLTTFVLISWFHLCQRIKHVREMTFAITMNGRTQYQFSFWSSALVPIFDALHL
ncbi:uncharacterized protein BCR38DRAFT_208938 [Pseudomassariella vexata]|uniref:Uncharacterized protein n=1 Tax=Pseudomassariella vexata TaxID=1141098 RepID=A0A1Y2DY89_9PEZI|nr:uncharacterized protein BCR38DRAFT_208938 [Pseudomassariella vexata]ORY64179.1 hypothetical protein BCR38DRAFT_208938 [Pseudomassariella vexata]